MATFGAVLDTCVLYPMPIADTLLLAAQRGLYAFHLLEPAPDRSYQAVKQAPYGWAAAASGAENTWVTGTWAN